MTGSYLASNVCAAGVLLIGGHQRDLNKYYLPRGQANVPIPEVFKQMVKPLKFGFKWSRDLLFSQIFPKIDEDLAAAQERGDAKVTEFLRLMDFIRTALIQDAAVVLGSVRQFFCVLCFILLIGVMRRTRTVFRDCPSLDINCGRIESFCVTVVTCALFSRPETVRLAEMADGCGQSLVRYDIFKFVLVFAI